MNFKHLVIGTLLHVLLTVVFMFLSIGANLGRGFKDNWSALDQVYFQFSVWGMRIFRGILNLFGEQLLALPGVIQLAAVVLNSIVCVWICLWFYKGVFKKTAI